MPHFFADIPREVFDAIGVAGFGLYVLNYTLLTIERLTSRCRGYFALNAVAALFVLIGLTASFNLASALIQGFWIVISVMAIVIRTRPSREMVDQPEAITVPFESRYSPATTRRTAS